MRKSPLLGQAVGDCAALYDKLRQSVLREDWSACAEVSATGMAKGQMYISELFMQLEHTAEQNEQHTFYHHELMDDLITDCHRCGVTKDEVLSILKERGKLSSEKIGITMERLSNPDLLPSPLAPQPLDHNIYYVIGLACKSFQGKIHAHYNLEYLNSLKADQSQMMHFAHESLEASCTRMQTFLDKTFVQLYQASLLDSKHLYEAAQAVKTGIENESIRLCSNLARFRQTASHLRRAGKNTHAEKLGYLLCIGGDFLREAVSTYVALSRISASINQKSMTQWQAKTHTLPLDLNLDNGKNTEIAHLDTDTSEEKLLEIKGFVLHHQSYRTHDKSLVSRMVVVDPSSKKHINAIGLYAHFGHMGISKGSYINLNGYYRSASSLAKNGPAFHIQALAPSKLKKQSWKAALFDLARPWYLRWPRDMNMRCSMTHQRNGTVNYSGAAEIIYTKFFKE